MFVNVETAKSLGVFSFDIFRDQFHDARKCGIVDSLEQVAALAGVERFVDQEKQAHVVEVAQAVGVLFEVSGHQFVRINQADGKFGRQIFLRLWDAALMVEIQPQFTLQMIERTFRIFAVFQECLAILDHVNLIRFAMTLDPAFEQRVDFVEVLFVLRMEAMEEVIVFAAGHQLFEGSGSILRQGELFPEGDLLCMSFSYE